MEILSRETQGELQSWVSQTLPSIGLQGSCSVEKLNLRGQECQIEVFDCRNYYYSENLKFQRITLFDLNNVIDNILHKAWGKCSDMLMHIITVTF